MIKQIPAPTVDVIFPPNTNHHDFEDFANHPFRHDANGFELVNAWWLAESSLLAYANSEFVRDQFDRAGLHLAGPQPLSGPSTQCYIAHNDDFVIVAFRGTQVLKPGAGQDLRKALKEVVSDILTDANFKLVDSGTAGSIHLGFKEALAEVSSELSAILNELKTENAARTVWFTGHSLGAALATLAAQSYDAVKGLYTFGSPRVGDKIFAADFDVNAFRFVNGRDIVTRVPPRFLPGPYKHVGQVKHIDRNHIVRDHLPRKTRLIDNVRRTYFQLFGRRAASATKITDGVPGNDLIDHTPLYYALHIWNHYFASK